MNNYYNGLIVPFNVANNEAAELTDEFKNENKLNINNEMIINETHELITPLNVIYGAAQLIEHYLKNDVNNNFDKIESSVELIKQNSFRLMKIINNILDLHKIETGLFKLDYNYINIVEVVEDVVQIVSKKVRDKQLHFIFDTDSEEKFLMADTENIERMLLNILSNAVKYSNPGGKIFVNVSVRDYFVEIAVIDNGVGIKRKHLNNIFNSFVRGDKSLSRISEGCGLGLKISKAIIEAHGGSIHVSSNPNKGSAFIIKLPCKKNDTIYTLFPKKVINYDSLNEMINIEFSDIENMVW